MLNMRSAMATCAIGSQYGTMKTSMDEFRSMDHNKLAPLAIKAVLKMHDVTFSVVSAAEIWSLGCSRLPLIKFTVIASEF